MSNEYIKLWDSYQDYFQPLGDDEVGRLVRGMQRYKATGEEPEFTGNERFVWPAIRRDIDEALKKMEDISKARSEAGRRGGRPKNESKGFSVEEEEANEIKKNKCFYEEAKKAMEKEKEKDVSPNGDTNPPLTPQGEGVGERPHRFSAKVYIQQYTQDAELQQLLLDWLEMRKKMRAPNTERAIAENLRLLPQMAQQSGLSLQDYMRGIIRRGWRAFYPIRDGPPGPQNRDDGRGFDWLTGR